MNDEKYVFFQDVKEKKVTGYSARKQKRHGKGGRVKLPSDYLTKKELKNMSGECKSYRMNSPMKWREFKSMPEDLQIAYIKAIKEKWNPSIGAIAIMLGVDRGNFSRHLHSLGFEKGKKCKTAWDKKGFAEWCFGNPVTVELSEEEVKPEAVEETAVSETVVEDNAAIQPCETEEDAAWKKAQHDRMEAFENRLKKSVPVTGSMTFEDLANNVLITLESLLANKKVCLHVEWTVVED